MKPGLALLLPRAEEWWSLPSGRLVSIRRIEQHEGHTEVVVRYLDEQGGMAQGEFHLSVSYIARGRKVSHD